MTNPKSLYFLIIFLLFTIGVDGQSIGYINYTTADGLSSDETYYILQDNKGYIWISSDKGISKYNGIDFKNYTKSDGLLNNTIFNIYEDIHGRIWMVTIENELFYIDGGRIYPYAYNHVIPHVWDGINSIEVDSVGTVFLYYKDFVKLEIDADGDLSQGNLLDEIVENDSVVSQSFADTSYLFTLNSDIEWRYLKGIDYSVYSINNVLKFAFNNKPNSTLKLDEQIIDFEVKNDKLVVACKNKLKLYSINNQQLIYELTLDGVNFHNAIFDSQNNIWATTNNAGVIKIPSFVNFLEEGDEAIKQFLSQTAQDSNIYHPSDILKLSYFTNFRFYNYKMIELLSPEAGIIVKKNRCYSISSDGLYMHFGFMGQINTYDIEKQMVINQYILRKKNVTSILGVKNGVFIGTLSGLYFLENDQLISKREEHPLFKERIQDIKEIGQNSYLIATRGEGIVFTNADTTFIINRKNGLVSDITNQLFVVDDTSFLVASNKGVQHLVVNSNYSIFGHTEINNSSNLNTTDALQVALVDSILYVGFTDHVEAYNLSDIHSKQETNIPLFITQIYLPTQKRNIPLDVNTELRYFEDDVSISYEAIDYQTVGNLVYRYRLGENSDWIVTTARTVNFNGLQHGTRTFYLQVQKNDGSWTESVTHTFSIGQAVWTTWWFYVLLNIVMIAAIFAGFRWFISNERKKVALEKELQRIEQQALNAQMNPHFVFNALNTVQDYILSNDKLKASDFLGNFSRLIRFTFENNKTSTITLQDEINTLNQYLKLERMRFEERFDFAIECDDAINKSNCLIPTLLVQPFVENAVWHGVMSLNKRGFIKVTFDKEGHRLKVRIEDNGIGITESKAKKLRKGDSLHKSSGINMTKNRIKIINSLKNIDSVYVEEDAFPNETNKGTRITFTVPFNELKD